MSSRPGQLRAAGFAAVRMAHRYPRCPAAATLALIVVTAAIRRLGWAAPFDYVLPVGVLILTGLTGWWVARFVARPHTTAALIRRRTDLDQRHAGVASRLDVAEHASSKALRLRAHILRPSLAQLTRRERRRLDARQVGVEIARLGWGWWGEQVWSSCEDATCRVAGPRTGKTLSLACHGLDAPGALITTSTRLDLAEHLHLHRAARGAVHIFNPAGLGALPSTVRWRVLSGCEDFATAQRRAGDLIPESSGEGERWDMQARRILAVFLHAAAVDGRSMRDVMRWVYDGTPAGRDEVVTALLQVPVGGRDRAAVARGFWTTNDRTRTSITTTMAIPLAWMADDRARTLGDADPTDTDPTDTDPTDTDPTDADPTDTDPIDGKPLAPILDVTRLIERGETLHLIGHEDQGGLSPLIGALVAEIAHAARTLAAHQPSGRLDPPLTMLLDEAALVCPVPLDRWTADMGGRGVTLHISVQSLSQLRQRWGADGAGTILANVAAFIVFGGSVASDDLNDLSRLTGEHRMKVIGRDHDHDTGDDGERRGEYRWVPVLSPAQIRDLELFQILVMRRGLHTLIGYAPVIADRRGWKTVSLQRAVPTPNGITVAAPDDLESLLTDTTTERQPRRSRPDRITARLLTTRAGRFALRFAELVTGATLPKSHPSTDAPTENPVTASASRQRDAL